MLSCSRVIQRLPKLTRQSYINQLCRPLKYIGTTSVGNLWFSSNACSKKTCKPAGTTIKPEECMHEIYKKPDDSQKQESTQSCGSGKNGKKKRSISWKQWAILIISGITIYSMASAKMSKSWKLVSQTDVSKNKCESKKQRKCHKKIKVPPSSSSIPMEVSYLLIGGGTAAFSAFRSIKSRDPKAKVLVITGEEDFPYMRPPLSKELWYNSDRCSNAQLQFKQWNGTQRSIFYEPAEFYSDVDNLIESEKGGVAVATGWKVKEIDVPRKTVTLDDGYVIKYDKCLIATGASPKNLPVFGDIQDEVNEKVLTFRTKKDFLELEDVVFDPQCKNIVIVGGGFLGSELACSLAHNLDKSKRVFQVYKENFIMAQVLPEYLSKWATKKAMKEGVNCIPNSEVEDYSYDNGRLSLVLSGDKTLVADQVIVAVGVKPNTDLAKSSHLEIHPQIGGFLVNAELEARSDLWVAGDAACFYDVMLGRRRVEHHDHAVVSGRLAGENMTGAGKPYLHQSMFWSDLGPEVGYEAIGIVDSSLPTVGVFANNSEVRDTRSDESVPRSGDKKVTSKDVQPVVQKSEVKPKVIENVDGNCQSDGDEQKYNNNDFGKGVIFYLRDDIVVGIVLWNIFSRTSIARQVLARGTKYDDLNEVAKLFTIHDD